MHTFRNEEDVGVKAEIGGRVVQRFHAPSARFRGWLQLRRFEGKCGRGVERTISGRCGYANRVERKEVLLRVFARPSAQSMRRRLPKGRRDFDEQGWEEMMAHEDI